MKHLTWIVIIFIAFPVFAQQEDPATAAFQALDVSNVRLRLSEENGIELIFNASPTICEDLLVDISSGNDWIEVNVFAPRNYGVCNTFAPYEPVIALPELASDQAYLLFLNDYRSTFFLTDPGTDSSDEPFAAYWEMDNALAPYDVVESFVDSINFTATGEGITVQVSGNHPDGCETEAYTRVYSDDIEANVFHVDQFRLIPEGIMCPAVLMPYEAELLLEIGDGDIVEIDGRYFRIESDEAIEIKRTAITINNVEIITGTNGNIVAVSGTADCGFEPVEHSTDRDFMSAIEIITYSAVDQPCGDAITQYDGGFILPVLPVVINGVAYDASGQINAPINAQSDDLAAEGNFMSVDTVIESVEVAILESFPMQLQLTVSGYQPDGCDFPVEVEQSVDGNNVTLHIFRNVPADVMCTMNIVSYEDTIQVDGSFTGGTVTIQVNDFTTSVDL